MKPGDIVTIDINDTDAIDDELYQMIVDAFIAVCERDHNLNLVESELMLGEITLTAKIAKIED